LGILSCGLLKASLSKKWRTAIKSNQLCLVSTFHPEAGFQIGNAMARNKYIYCLSDVALVVQSGKGEGGTWAGATENLKHRWAKLFVKAENQSDGLEALIGLGATPLSVPSENSRTDEWLRALLTAEQPAKAGSSTESGQIPLRRNRGGSSEAMLASSLDDGERSKRGWSGS
jgi:predicted Rossmann fold nucleotide-binding protein DprA/Smf involved in DNA uptake